MAVFRVSWATLSKVTEDSFSNSADVYSDLSIEFALRNYTKMTPHIHSFIHSLNLQNQLWVERTFLSLTISLVDVLFLVTAAILTDILLQNRRTAFQLFFEFLS